MIGTRTRFAWFGLLALATGGCGGSSVGGGARGLASDPRDPAAAPPGAGTVTVDMAGVWRIAGFTVEAWDPWELQPAIGDLLEYELSIAPRPGGGFALESFGWIPDLAAPATFGSRWSVEWERNLGDGRLLVFAYIGTATSPPVPPPGVHRWVPRYGLGVAVGAIGVDEMLGRCVESGGTAGLRSFTFLARRSRAGPVAPDPRDAAAPPDTPRRALVDMSGDWQITDADVVRYEPAVTAPGGHPDPIGSVLRIGARRPAGFGLEAFGAFDPIGTGTPADWNVTWARNAGDGTLLIYSRNSSAAGPGPAAGRSEHRLGVACTAVDTDELQGRYVEFGGPLYAGHFDFTFTARRRR